MIESIDATFQEENPAQSAALAPVTLFGTDDPVLVIEQASRIATALVQVVEKRGLISTIKGKKYPHVEAWQTMAAMLSLSSVCEWTRQIDGGWEARVVVYDRNHQVISSAEAQCTKQENGKAHWEPYAIRSMAQTRATSKAYRANLGFIMVLAGYCATPAEEMPKDTQPPSIGFLCSKAIRIGAIADKDDFPDWVRSWVPGCSDIPRGGKPTTEQLFAIDETLEASKIDAPEA